MKIDKHLRDFSNRLNAVSDSSNDNGSDNSEITKDDDYYLAIGLEPPRFAYYRYYRVKNTKDEWRKQTLEAAYDSVTQDELDYSLKRRLRMSPEQRYQHKKRNWFLYELSYLYQTVDENGKAVDVIKEYGCGQWSTKTKMEGEGEDCCVPEYRYYPEYGRIDDNEVITEHRELEEEYRKRNRIVISGTFSSRITILIGKLMKGTLDASAHTAHANLPPGTRTWWLRLKALFRFGININPHLQVATSNDEFGNSSIPHQPV